MSAAYACSSFLPYPSSVAQSYAKPARRFCTSRTGCCSFGSPRCRMASSLDVSSVSRASRATSVTMRVALDAVRSKGLRAGT
eukprot:scaffold11398_cov108-Isochrysis_galbana.AAC.5